MRREWALFLFLGSLGMVLLEGPAAWVSIHQALRGPYPRETQLDSEAANQVQNVQESAKWDAERFTPLPESNALGKEFLDQGQGSEEARFELPSLDEN